MSYLNNKLKKNIKKNRKDLPNYKFYPGTC